MDCYKPKTQKCHCKDLEKSIKNKLSSNKKFKIKREMHLKGGQ